MASDEQLEKAWRLVRDREIAAGTERGRRVLTDPDFAAQRHKRMLVKLRAIVQRPWPPGEPPTSRYVASHVGKRDSASSKAK